MAKFSGLISMYKMQISLNNTQISNLMSLKLRQNDLIQNMSQQNLSIWNQRENNVNATILGFNSNIRAQIQEIQNRTDIDSTKKNSMIQNLYSQMNDFKIKNEAYLSRAKEYDKQVNELKLKPLQTEETMTQNRIDYLNKQNKDYDMAAQTLEKMEESSRKAIFGNGGGSASA